MSSVDSTSAEKPAKKKETFGEMVLSFAFMIFLALIFRSVAFEPFHIPSGSMLSTLYEGDYVFVNKFSYGYSRFSFPFAPDVFDGRMLSSEPKRGDVVVFRNPSNLRMDYIKRVIGLPGDTVQMKRGRLYLNGKLVDQTRGDDVTLPNECGTPHSVARYEEALPGGETHTVLDDSKELNDPLNTCRVRKEGNLDPDNTALYTVPAGHYFMMGDNRDHSQDSRFSPELGYPEAPGFVPFENLIGRAEIIAFSLKGKEGRFFKWID